MSLYFKLENDLDAAGVLELGLPPGGATLTTSSSCAWTQSETTYACKVATVQMNKNTIHFYDSNLELPNRKGVDAGKVITLTLGLENILTTAGIHGPIKLVTSPESGGYGDENALDMNPVFGMYSVGGKDVTSGLTLVVNDPIVLDPDLLKVYGATRTAEITVKALGDKVHLKKPWRLFFSVETPYRFDGSCNGAQYGMTTNDPPDRYIPSPSDYTCNFLPDSNSGYVTLHKDLPADTTFEMQWDLGIINPIYP